MVRSRSTRSARIVPPRTSRRRGSLATRPFIAFLLIASFGILFAGCGAPPPEDDVFTFTQDDVARFRELAGSPSTGSGVVEDLAHPTLAGGGAGSGSDALPALDLSMGKTYDAVRSGPAAVGEELYRVTNAYVNVRKDPKITSPEIDRLTRGDTLTVVEFVDAAWAKVTLAEGKEGYVSTRYIAKIVSEAQLSSERKKYEGTYFVDFGFLNVRKAPDGSSEKIGELPGQALVRPISIDKVWARVPFNSGEGYVAVQYLTPFSPQFLVRQESYQLPILQYRMGTDDRMMTTLASHIAALKKAGVTIWTLRDLRELVLTQEEKDARVPPKTVVLTVSDVAASHVAALSQSLSAAGVSATLFVQTSNIGMSGITEKTVKTLIANGFDLQSSGHTGDDLRSLTNAQMDLELSQSRALLEEITGKEVFAIGYPLGGVNERVMELASKKGYLFGVGSAPEKSFSRTQFLRLPSFVVSGAMTPEDVLGIVVSKESALRIRTRYVDTVEPRGIFLAIA